MCLRCGPEKTQDKKNTKYLPQRTGKSGLLPLGPDGGGDGDSGLLPTKDSSKVTSAPCLLRGCVVLLWVPYSPLRPADPYGWSVGGRPDVSPALSLPWSTSGYSPGKAPSAPSALLAQVTPLPLWPGVGP